MERDMTETFVKHEAEMLLVFTMASRALRQAEIAFKDMNYDEATSLMETVETLLATARRGYITE